MDIQPQQNQTTISDDQELAKALAGLDKDNAGFTPPAEPEAEKPEEPEIPPIAEIAPAPEVKMPTPVISNSGDNADLEEIKQQAIGELRPIIERLDVPADEKFDAYLLLLRSTDDKTLIAPAHEIAKSIQDETKRAQALLNIIKEIDYLTSESIDEVDNSAAQNEPELPQMPDFISAAEETPAAAPAETQPSTAA